MKCQTILRFINKKLKNLFNWWGNQIYKYPFFVILTSILICGGLGYMYTLYQQIQQQEDLYLPLNSEALDHLNYIKDIFKTKPRSQIVFLSEKSNSSILTKQVFFSILQFHQGLLEVSQDGLTYNDLCYKLDEGNNCDFQGHVLEFFEVERGEFDIDRVADDQELLQLINSGKGQPEFYPQGTQQYISVTFIFGQTTPTDIITYKNYTNNIQDAKALILPYQLGSKQDLDLYFKYQKKLQEYARKFSRENEYIEVYIYTSSAVQRISEEVVNEDMYLFYIGASLVVVWCFIIIGKLQLTKSRISMGIVGILTVIMGYIQALGFGTLIGLKGNPFVWLVPFLMIGIGVDDMFVILDCIERVSPTLTGKKKLAAVLKLAGPSITLTSITNVFSFLMGSYTSIPALRILCIFASMGMFFDFFNQITIFCAVLSLDLRRSQKGCGDCLGLCFCKPNSIICCKGKYMYDSIGQPRKPFIKKFMKDYLGPLLVKFPINLMILTIIGGVLGLSIFGSTKLKFHFDYEDVIPQDTYIDQVINFRDKYFDRQPRNIRFYTIKTEFSSQQTQLKLIELKQSISSCNGCQQNWVVEDSTNSWYQAFRGWVFTNQCTIDNFQVSLNNSSVIPEQSFYQCLQQWLSTNSGSKFQNKILFGSSKQQLKGAFISVLISNEQETEDKIQIMKDLRDIAQHGPGNTFPYDFLMSVAEQALIFLNEFAISLGLSGVSILTLVVVTLGDIFIALYVFLVIALIVVSLLGFL